ncbi:hypothetical protein R1sor_007444 [Riccia sorocarpa]|uniref:Uncharacterized protein n=1 Tax=Riccia sorocarpa TaxID=122646 RepID=A0ABD3HQV4_9MARC
MAGVVCLADVQNAVVCGQDVLFEQQTVYVTHYEASCPWTSKFTYRACNYQISEGRRCLLSLERKKICQEGQIRGVFRPVYRFQLHLADGSMRGRTLKATVFNNVAVLLDKTASELRALPFSVQEQIVSECCQEKQRFLVSIRTGPGEPIIEDISRIDERVDVDLAVAGKHYDIYLQSKYGFIYVCLVGDCPRNARNMESFKPHMVVDHGFTCLDREADDVLMQSVKSGKRPRCRHVRPTRHVPTDKDYLQVRTSLKAQWVQTQKRKWQACHVEAEKSAKFSYR